MWNASALKSRTYGEFMLFLKQVHYKAETLNPLNRYKYHSRVVAATIPSPHLTEETISPEAGGRGNTLR